MKLIFVRHGETTGDVEDRYGGWYDDSLTQKGRQQLRITAEKLQGVKADALFVSPLKRAKESAEIINLVLQTKLSVVEGLRERNYGILGGLTKVEALEKYPHVVALHRDHTNTDPEGESWEDFNARVISAFEKIVKQNLQTVVIVAHGGSIKALLRHLGEPLPDSIADGGIIEVEC